VRSRRSAARCGEQVDGLLVDPDGLGVEELLALRARHGDRFVQHHRRSVHPREQLFELDCDVLVPGARPDSITADVAQRVRCAVVAPGANVSYGSGAVEVLHERGILAVPDFVSNSGGVLLYDTIRQDEEPTAALAAIEATIRDAVVGVLVAADAHGITPSAAAFREARDYFAKATGAPGDSVDALFPA
jgi:glutamate dehydrogenase (NAD(P)+)